MKSSIDGTYHYGGILSSKEGQFWFGQLAIGRSFTGHLEIGSPISFHFNIEKLTNADSANHS